MMRFTFESSVMMPHMAEMLSVLISGARIHVDDIQYADSQRLVEIGMQRKELIGFKKTLFGGTRPVYGQNTIKTLLRVKDAIGINIKTDDRLVDELNSSFTVLLGVKVNDNELYLGSVEEAQGEPLCQVSIKVERLNIEWVDAENQGH